MSAKICQALLKKIISGGQTGADRAALDAGMESGFVVGGYCPWGRMAEDGPIDIRYPLDEIDGGYEDRTKRNVEYSNGTVVFYDSHLYGGTRTTVAFCNELKKPYELIDIDQLSILVAAKTVASFISNYKVQVLNVAGPRQSSCPKIYAYVHNTIKAIIAQSKQSE